MKTSRIVYWVATGITALMMTFSAFAYITKPEIKAGFHHLGFPDYFRVELAVAKLIGAVLLLAPVPQRIKEWTYAGFVITFVSAFIAHVSSGDPVGICVGPVVFLVVLLTSYIYYGRLRQSSSKPFFRAEVHGAV
jgi:hypothetical protein